MNLGAWKAARRPGGSPQIAFAELYFHTAYDPTVASEGRHAMSVFAQYVTIDSSGADETLENPGPVMNGTLDAIEAHAPDIRECLYMCGAATHPGGSVIGLNGRNAAMAVIEDLSWPRPPA